MASMLTLIVVGLLAWLVGSVALSMLVGRHLAHQTRHSSPVLRSPARQLVTSGRRLG